MVEYTPACHYDWGEMSFLLQTGRASAGKNVEGKSPDLGTETYRASQTDSSTRTTVSLRRARI